MIAHRNGKYSCVELERRFLLRELPAVLRGRADYRRLTDRYISGTRLRLRHVETAPSGPVIFKFAQTFADAAQSSGQTTITNVYLNETEYRRLHTLGGDELIKRRYALDHEGHRFAVDVFEGRHEGLILAEVELGSEEELRRFALPSFALSDVTDDIAFTGGALATVATSDFRRMLADRLADASAATLP